MEGYRGNIFNTNRIHKDYVVDIFPDLVLTCKHQNHFDSRGFIIEFCDFNNLKRIFNKKVEMITDEEFKYVKGYYYVTDRFRRSERIKKQKQCA